MTLKTVGEDRWAEACVKIAETIASMKNPSSAEIERIKLEITALHHLPKVPSNPEIIAHTPLNLREVLRERLAKKPTRILSGITVITVVAPIRECPHGRCVYCPGGEGAPRSYTGREESVESARKVGYDPYLQVERQLRKLEAMGHKVDKVELIFIGGTFNAMPRGLREWFVKRCLDALNGWSAGSLREALKGAEYARRRVSGITVETRPDWARLSQANALLELGVTRVELGVQAPDDEIYRLVRRGHTVEDVVEATKTLKDLGFKVGYHLMPGLPGSSPIKDLEMYRMLWRDERFRPDMVKIYPTLILPGTELHELWKKGEYAPYPDDVLVKLLAEWLTLTPSYVRIQRIQREIPPSEVEAGTRIGNLRERVEEYLRKMGKRCRCIRCREVGRLVRKGVEVRPERVKLMVSNYSASGGEEFFIAFEDLEADALIGFLRLRAPSRVLRQELERAAIVRELHVYGWMTPVGDKRLDGWQHKGYGSTLLREAERIAAERLDARKLVVISGVGVKEYYYKRGYVRDGPYVSKRLMP